MERYKVVVLLLAKTDIREARFWYEKQQPGLGKRLTADMAATLRKLARNPLAFAVRYKTMRLANFSTFPYAAHFYVNDENDIVYITAILHTSRHPDTDERRW